MPSPVDAPITWCAEMRQTLASMRASGASFSACAERLGVAYGTARKQARRMGLSTSALPHPAPVSHHGTTRLRRRNERGWWIPQERPLVSPTNPTN